MAELVDARDSKSRGVIHGSSILPPGTMKPHILVIVGPTASGKSDLAVKLAKKLDGEVISADSRQVYKGLDIGTGKITKKEMKGIRHHLLDVADPKKKFNVIEYVKLADKAIADILKRGKLPIVCGGTGFYIQALVDRIAFPEVSADTKLRKELSSKTAPQLLTMLKKLDPKRAKEIAANPSDSKNARRIIRAIEIALAMRNERTMEGRAQIAHRVVSRETVQQRAQVPSLRNQYRPEFIGIQVPRDELRNKIRIRLEKRLKAGMLEEVTRLHRNGLSWKRMEELGLEYRYVGRCLQGKMSKQEMVEKLNIEIGQYAKRQMTWFNRDRRIKWQKAG